MENQLNRFFSDFSQTYGISLCESPCGIIRWYISQSNRGGERDGIFQPSDDLIH